MFDNEQKRSVDIGTMLDLGRWGGYQKWVLALVAAAIVLDGFDNQVLGFAIPVLIKEWGVTREAFAIVFALGFTGMIIGTAVGGWFGDLVGRRWALIASVAIFGIATGATAFVTGIDGLMACRLIAGFGLGGAMPNATTLLAEFSPIAKRSLAITIGIVCIPLGGVVGGLIAARVLPEIGWRTLFGVAGMMPIAVAVILVLFLPESPRFLVRRGRDTAARVVLRRIGYDIAPDVRLIDTTDRRDVSEAAVATLFSSEFRADTLALWAAFFFCLLGTYLVFSWAPTFLGAEGFSIAQSSTGLAIFNIGGVLGALGGAFLMERRGSRRSLTWLAAAAAVGAGVLATTSLDPAHSVAASGALFVEGALINAVQTGLYVLAAQVYPVAIRASGVGATAGLGRGGALASSFIGVAVLAGGAVGFFGAIGASMAATLVALVVLKRHAPPATRQITRAASARVEA